VAATHVDKHWWKQNVLARVTGRASDLILFYRALEHSIGPWERWTQKK
jgi:hypothetical protein